LIKPEDICWSTSPTMLATHIPSQFSPVWDMWSRLYKMAC